MKILLPQPLTRHLAHELRRAGKLEIGGLLMGEHLGDTTFRVVDISVQRSGGSQSHFVRDPTQHQAQLEAFFARTGTDYSRFNYLGEWHSHPSFEPLPSAVDVRTMQSIVNDPAVGVNFLVLMIVRRARWGRVAVNALGFRRGGSPFPVSLAAEAEECPGQTSWGGLVRKLFTR